MFNDRWWFDRYNLEGLKTYINDLTFGANIFLGKLDPYTGVFWRNQVYQYLFRQTFLILRQVCFFPLGRDNYLLKWRGPFKRSDADKRYPGNMEKDTKK